ncbi:hypothetical protein Agub_g12245, partial [Astrephomene gubernaculifera]
MPATLYANAHLSFSHCCRRVLQGRSRHTLVGRPNFSTALSAHAALMVEDSALKAHPERDIPVEPLDSFVEGSPAASAVAVARQMGGENPAASRPLLSVAPMMDWTDVHFRQLARLLSRHTWLWTEMVVDKTIIHTQNLDKYLWFPPEQRPLVLQLGGSDPATLAAAAARAAEYGYDEINLNCGCPSDRVAGAGCFGAALMLQPALVAECMSAIAAAVEGVVGPAAAAPAPTATATPVGGSGEAEEGPGEGPEKGSTGAGSPPALPLPSLTVKCRLGVDEADSYEQLREFVRVVSERSPVRHFVVHARKAFLNGLSPHQNRTVPPLRHHWAWALAAEFPHLQFSLNGGVLGCHEARAALLAAHPQVPYTRPVLPPSDPYAAAASVCATSSSLSPSFSTATSVAAPAADPAGPQEQHVDGADAGDGVSGSCCPGYPPAPAAAPLPPAAAAAAAGTAVVGNGGGIEGVMIGRGAYNDPWGCLADADRAVFGEAANPAPSRRWVIQRYREYAEPMVGRWFVKPDGHADPSIRTLMRPLLNLFHGEPGCKRWKNAVDEVLRAGPSSFGEVLDRTLHIIPDHVLDAPPRQPDLASLPPFPLDPLLPEPSSRAGINQAPPGSKTRKGATGNSDGAAASEGMATQEAAAAAVCLSADAS